MIFLLWDSAKAISFSRQYFHGLALCKPATLFLMLDSSQSHDQEDKQWMMYTVVSFCVCGRGGYCIFGSLHVYKHTSVSSASDEKRKASLDETENNCPIIR